MRPALVRRRQWLLWRDEKNARRRERMVRRGVAYGSKALINRYTEDSTSTDGRAYTIHLPERLDFDEHYESTVSHFYNVRLAAQGKIRLKYLDFKKLRYISASAALVLASEVDRWNHRVRKKLRARTKTWHEDIKRLLAQMGYFELLGLPQPDLPDYSKPTVFLPFKSGSINEENPGKLAQELRIEIEATVGAQIKKFQLFGGLSEAITNVIHHAYPKDATLKHWWLSASYDQSSRQLRVTFYDQGLGIPVTLPNSKWAEFIVDLFKLTKDSQKIEAAMVVGRSATDLPERGKGLADLLEFAKAYDGGRLAIHSLRGKYWVDARKDGDKTILEGKKLDFERSIGGTLIEWSVNIPSSP